MRKCQTSLILSLLMVIWYAHLTHMLTTFMRIQVHCIGQHSVLALFLFAFCSFVPAGDAYLAQTCCPLYDAQLQVLAACSQTCHGHYDEAQPASPIEMVFEA